MFTFQGNSDPAHSAAASLQWFQENQLNIPVMLQTSVPLKIRLHSFNLRELEQFVHEEWTKIQVVRRTKVTEMNLKRLYSVTAANLASVRKGL